jgi:iron complex outermembrane receptor protein
MNHRSKSRLMLRTSALAVVLALAAGAAFAQARNFDIRAQPLSSALRDFSRQSGAVVTAPGSLVRGRTAPAVQGALSPDQALDRLLKGTDLRARRTASGALVIVQETAELSAPAGDAAPEEDAAFVEEVLVTASRIQRGGFTAPTPTTVLGSEDLQRAGLTSIGQIVTQIPAFMPSSTPTSSVLSSDSGRGQFLDLRGLGASRTLTLVDGRRHVPTTTGNLVDTNAIPMLLVDRVEVVTGGASAAWGSDAVAGVVNLIFKKNLEGLSGDFQIGQSQQGDSKEYKGSLAFGTGFAGGRGHFSIAAEAERNTGVLHQSDRSWGARNWGIVGNPAYAPGNGQFPRLVVPDARLAIATEGGLILSGALFGTRFLPGGATAPMDFGQWDFQGAYTRGGDGAAWGRYAALQLPLDRANVYTHTTFDFTSNLTGFLDVSFAESETRNPNLVQPFDLPVTISADNAFLPSSVRDQLALAGETQFDLGRLDTDFGFIKSRDNNQTMRLVAGLQGKFSDGWSWEAYYEYGRTRHNNSSPGNRVEANYARAVDSVADPVSGDPVCRSTLSDPGNGCVPINLFGYGAPSAAAIDYVTATQWQLFHLTEHVASVSVQGEPFSTWAGSVSIAAGAEYRRDEAESSVDALSASDAFLIGNPKAIRGAYDVTEGFLETVVPLLADQPLVKSLDFSGAVRLTNYSTSGTVTTWKAGLSYAVNDQLRFRATRSRDIRAPNIDELFATPSLNFANVVDPLSGNSVLITTPIVPNGDLKPEEADTTILGLVYQPSWFPGFRLAVDGYDIELKSAIGQLDPQDVLNRCDAGAANLCQFIGRDGGGALTSVTLTNLNLSRLKTSGVDIEATYRTDLSRFVDRWKGSVTLRLLTTYVDELSVDDGTQVIDRAGDVGFLGGNGVANGVPHWRGTVSGAYEYGPLTLYLAGRYVGGGAKDHTITDLDQNHLDSRFYVDGSVQYTLSRPGLRRLQVYANVSNLFDRDPPISPSSFIVPQATNPVLYDVIGRTASIGVRFQY